MLVMKIWIAYVLDLIFGDPQNIIHPVQVIGKMISSGEKFLLGENSSLSRRYKFFAGMILNITVISVTYAVTYLIYKSSERSIIFMIAEIYLMYTIFSINSLAREGNRVYNILKEGNIEKARKDLSYLVSRDTETMDEKMIIRSTMETISENTVDGIVAPMFYMFLGGLPLSMAYKAINTLDSMVGYKNEKYIDFGKFSAKLDDVANFIPARITGIFIILASMILGYNGKEAWRIFFRDRKNHSSPNSAHSEASVAGALGVQFGGRVSYFGKEVDKPTIGDKKKEFEIEDIKKNCNYTDEAFLKEYIRKIFMGEAFDGSGKVYGMGHAIYTLSDPRAVILKKKAYELAKEKGQLEEFELFSNVEKFTKEIGKELKGENFEICANVDLYSGFVYKLLNIPTNIFTPLFALARIASWNAHRIEQITSDKKIIRPAYKAIDVHGKLLV